MNKITFGWRAKMNPNDNEKSSHLIEFIESYKKLNSDIQDILRAAKSSKLKNEKK